MACFCQVGTDLWVQSPLKLFGQLELDLYFNSLVIGLIFLNAASISTLLPFSTFAGENGVFLFFCVKSELVRRLDAQLQENSDYNWTSW